MINFHLKQRNQNCMYQRQRQSISNNNNYKEKLPCLASGDIVVLLYDSNSRNMFMMKKQILLFCILSMMKNMIKIMIRFYLLIN